MTGKELEKKDWLEEFLRTGDITQLLKEIESNTTVKETTKSSSKSQRVAQWFGHREILGAEKVAQLKKRMYSFVNKKFAFVDIAEARQLTPAEAELLMDEYLDVEMIKEALEARQLQTKKMVFNSLSSALAAQGIEFPHQHNGHIKVEKFGKQFCREGTGRTDPVLNPQALEKLLGKEDWEKVTTATVIPERTEHVVDEHKLAELLHAHPAKLELVREALIPGQWKTPRFIVRNI